MNWKPFLLQSISIGVASISLVLSTFSVPFTSPSGKPPTMTSFCSCCADQGAWSLETREIADYEMEALNSLTLDGVANFYNTVAWPDDVSGLPTSDNDLFDLLEELVISIVRDQQNWILFFKTSKGNKGTLTLAIPTKATFFNVDNEGGPRPENKPPWVGLYKEIRLEGKIHGTGIFANGIAPKTQYRLVVQGSGNWCMMAEDFNRWNLAVSGPKAKYRIYGFFAKTPPKITR